MDHQAKRNAVVKLAREFQQRTVWVKLGLALENIQRQELYATWGFRSLREFATRDLGLSKSVFHDIMAGIDFLRRRCPEAIGAPDDPSPLGDYNKVALLVRADKRLRDERTMKELVEGVRDQQWSRPQLKKEIAKRLGRAAAPHAAATHRAADIKYLERLRSENKALRAERDSLRAKIKQLEDALAEANPKADAVIEKVRRQLAARVHPDIAGPRVTMQTINAILDELKGGNGRVKRAA